MHKKSRAISDPAFHSPIKKIVCSNSCPPTFHVLHLYLHALDTVDVLHPYIAVVSAVFEIVDVFELQVFVRITFVFVV